MPDPLQVLLGGVPAPGLRVVVGNVARVRADFLNEAGDPVDPGTVRFKYRKPGAEVVTLTAPHAQIERPTPPAPQVGIYWVELELDQPGSWHVRWEGEGAIEGAAEAQFVVRATAL